jgi:hypothetical protein
MEKKPDNRLQFHSTESESRVSLNADDPGIRVLEISGNFVKNLTTRAWTLQIDSLPSQPSAVY